ncbi:ATP synthase F1 subunit gamma [Planctomycetota bacterium]
MATTREIVKRRKSVSNIRKITKTMEMIATARFKKAHDRAVGARPYTEKITQLVATLAAGAQDADDQTAKHPLLRLNTKSHCTVLLVLTSNRGLCGGYNSSVIRLALQQIQALTDDGQQLDLRISGKKGLAALTYKGHIPSGSYTDFDDKTTYAAVEELADEFINLYTKEEIDAVQVVYTRFVSSARHYADLLNLLPLSGLGAEETEQEAPKTDISFYDFYPSVDKILEDLIPTMVRTRLFQCFTEAIVSEQVARMNAMKAATDNAEQMIEALTRQYNRARQSQITGELLDILGGAEALK